MRKRYGAQVRLEWPIHRALLLITKQSKRTMAQEVNWILFEHLRQQAKLIVNKST